MGPSSDAAPLRPPPRISWVSAYRGRAVASDITAALLAITAAFAISRGGEEPLRYLALSVGLFVVCMASQAFGGSYDRRKFGVSDEEYRSVLNAFYGVLGAGAVAALLLRVTIDPAYLVTLLITLPLLTVLGRFALRGWMRRQRQMGNLMLRTIVVGRLDSARQLIQSIRSEPHQGMDVVGVCASSPSPTLSLTRNVENVPILGTPTDTVRAAKLAGADAVALAADPDLSGVALRRLTWALADQGVELIVAPGLLDVAGPRLFVRPSTEMSLLHIQPPAPTRRTAAIKAAVDFLGSAALVLLLSPLILAVALAIKTTSRGPILFRLVRIGTNGEAFRIFKFRTMVVDAEKKLDALRHLSDGNTVQFKMKADPRITPVGTFLRKYSIDELPQLFNVLIGDMSLVGPRPQTQKEVDLYEPDAMRRLNVRPGMTGLWQVSGRSDLTWEESVRLDLRYVDNLSLTLDAHILMRTFRAVFGGGGAY